jgi:hypothetical protein
VKLDSVDMTGCTVSADSVSCPAAGLADGAHSSQVNVSDNAGNTTEANVNFTIDQTAPVVSNIQPTGDIFETTITISADYTDSGSGIDTGNVVVKLDSVDMTGCTVSADSVSCPATDLTLGAHSIQVDVGDNAGNTATSTASFTVASPPSCTTKYTDENGATIELFSDPAYTNSLCQQTVLSANTDYYVQIEHQTMNISSERPARRNYLRIYNMMGTRVNFGDGASSKTFTQQAGGPPYVYRSSFRTPATAEVYNLEMQLRSRDTSDRLYIRGWKTIVGTTASYIKTFSDSGYTDETDTFAPGAIVYVEFYSPVLADGTPEASGSTVKLYDFTGGFTSHTVTVSKPAASKYRVQFTMPTTLGDKGIRLLVRTSSKTLLGRPEVLIKIQ